MQTARDTTRVVEQLREKIRTLEAQPRQLVLTLRTGVEALDALGAFRLGGGVELCGEAASGRTTLALSLVAAACRERRLAAWVDGPQELYPPAAEALGVELPRLLIARPKAPGQLVWTAVQLLRSGAFTCVVLDVTHTGVQLSLTDSRKLLEAARAGGGLLVLVTGAAAPASGVPRLMLKTSGAAPRLVAPLRVVGAEEETPSGQVLRGGPAASSSAAGGSGVLGGSPPRHGVRSAAAAPGVAGSRGASSSDHPRRGAAEVAVLRPREASPPDVLADVTPTFLVEAPHGRSLSVPRAQLARTGPLRGRRVDRPWAPPPVHAVRPVESLQRPKKNLQRDGYPMTWGRPGRDSPLVLPRPMSGRR